jgi:glutamine---fructose-6-phosphate transaminase (isomerizing)
LRGPLKRSVLYYDAIGLGLPTRSAKNWCFETSKIETVILGGPMSDVVQDSVMLQNIWEQPQVVADCLAIDLHLPDWLQKTTSTQRLLFLACGSSRHAALVAQNWFESLAKIPTRVLDAAEWTDRAPLLEPNTTIVALSQSGKTKDLLEALAQIKATHSEPIKVLAIANVAASPLVQMADAGIVTPAGVEGAVAATKSFTAQLTVLARLVVDLAQSRGVLDLTTAERLRSDLAQLPKAIEATLAELKKQAVGEGWGLDWMMAESVVLLGRALMQPIALEGALKLKETCYVHAAGFGAGDFCHGPMAILKPGFPVIALMTDSTLSDQKMRSDLDRFRSFGSYIIGIGPRNHDLLPGLDEVLEVEPIADWLMPFLMVLPLQLLAYDWARSKGLDVDQPRYLTKFIG